MICCDDLQDLFFNLHSLVPTVVWIIKKKPKLVHTLPILPSYRPVKEGLPSKAATLGEDLFDDDMIRPGVPYHIANFIAPNAFLIAQPSSLKLDVLNITFQVGIYYSLILHACMYSCV